MALTVAVLVRGALHAERGQRLACGQLLEDQARAVTLPAHDGVGLVEVSSVLQTPAHRRHVLIEFSQLRLGLIGNAERVGRQGEGLAPVAALLRGEEDGRDLTQRVQRFSIVVLHRRAVNENQVRVRRTDGLEVGSTDGAEDRDVTRAIGQVVGDGGLAATRDDTDGSHTESERVIGRRLRQRHNASRMGREGHLLPGRVGDDAGLGSASRIGGRGRGGRGGGASSQGQGRQGHGHDGANSYRRVHVFLVSSRSRLGHRQA